ncbi:hypothetical protein BZA77DRAFT_313254 [Pyronema omphalodes]|nr:hypothetical protein BZA77DRAFT_313254 [Pyronema omphalodes]
MVILKRQTPGSGQAADSSPCVNICTNALTEAQSIKTTPSLCIKSHPFRTLLSDCQKCNQKNNTFLNNKLLGDFAPYLDYCASLPTSTDEDEPDENEPDENEPDENEGGESTGDDKPNSTATSTAHPSPSAEGDTKVTGNEVILQPTPTGTGSRGRNSPCYNNCSAALGTAIDIGQVPQLCTRNGDFPQKLNACSASCKNNNDALFLVGGLLNKMQPYASYCKWNINAVLSPGINDVTHTEPDATVVPVPDEQTQMPEPTSRSDLTTGGSKAWIAGAVLGPLLLVLLIFGIVFLLLRKRKRRLQSRKKSISTGNSDTVSEKDGEDCISEMPGRDNPVELEGDSPTVSELGVNEKLDAPRQIVGGEKVTYG